MLRSHRRPRKQKREEKYDPDRKDNILEWYDWNCGRSTSKIPIVALDRALRCVESSC